MVSVLLLYALDFRRLAEPHPGQAHSGVSDGPQNLFDNPTNIQLIMNALTYLTQQLVKFNNVVASSYSMSQVMSIACLLSVGHSTKLDPAAHDRTDSSTLATFRQVSPEAAAFPSSKMILSSGMFADFASINDAFDMSRFADYVSTRNDFVVFDHHSCASLKR